ncbi:hypothetical protein [Pontibacter anaerobius]|uniref:Uncharacterized protein n=1 Tax=Pontibacter anaerobius TaxID=2993940 RepID=A0ABT3RHE1_9BACT|nr:hypothetical protein [Pontibacter anaerobius]MCX2741263.1 hypothetical protein [Pontibacter anaerobius]
MQAFLYFNLTPAGMVFREPLVEQVRQSMPAVSVLDLDAKSDELLQHYALRLLREAEQAVVSIKSEDGTADLGSIMPLLEELFEEGKLRRVLLLGTHPRLERIFAARPHVRLKVVQEGDVLEEVKQFLGV